MIFYFHGFSSSSKSNKAEVIRSYFRRHQIYVPDYPSHQPERSIEFLSNYLEQYLEGEAEGRIMLMGSSLGGYYAQFLAKKFSAVSAVVLINPCLEPLVTLATQTGEHTNSVTGTPFQFTREDYEGFAQFNVSEEAVFSPTLVLLDEDDEIIDYRVAAEKYNRKGRVIVYPGGDHWFRHLDQALPEIEAFYRDCVQS